MAYFLSCLGLFGLACFHRRKAKERDWSSQGNRVLPLWLFYFGFQDFVNLQIFGFHSDCMPFGLVLCETTAGIANAYQTNLSWWIFVGNREYTNF